MDLEAFLPVESTLRGAVLACELIGPIYLVKAVPRLASASVVSCGWLRTPAENGWAMGLLLCVGEQLALDAAA